MPLSDRPTRLALRTQIRRELMDPNARWWSDSEIDASLEDWQNHLQSHFEFAWGTATKVTSTATHTLTSIASDILRVDAIYWNNYRISGRSKEDLEVLLREWRSGTTWGSNPRAAFQNDSHDIVIWPAPVTSGTLTFEYPRKLLFSVDSSPIQIPAWTRYSAKNYVCYRSYLRDGPNNDIQRALRYKAQFIKQLNTFRTIWDNYLPDKAPTLRPGAQYEADILIPPPAGEVTLASMPTSTFVEYTPTGSIDGSNAIFTVPVVPTEMQLFKNNGLVIDGIDYTFAGSTITFNPSSIPQTGDTLRAWVFRT